MGTSITRRTLQELTKALENDRFLLLKQEQSGGEQKTMSPAERKEAETLLKSKDLLGKTNALIGKSGVIGEVDNRLLMYFLFTSRKTNNPLHLAWGVREPGKPIYKVRWPS